MQDTWLVETYFEWLRSDCFTAASERREYEGVLRVLHDIPFFWITPLDENRAGDAITYRQSDFLSSQSDLDRMDQRWLHDWALSAPSVLEVLLGCCRRWSWYFEGEVAYYFGHMFVNMGFQSFPGRVLSGHTQEMVSTKVNDWMSHQIQPNGEGSPFPLHYSLLGTVDMRELDIWSQMNAYSAEHFQ